MNIHKAEDIGGKELGHVKTAECCINANQLKVIIICVRPNKKYKA